MEVLNLVYLYNNIVYRLCDVCTVQYLFSMGLYFIFLPVYCFVYLQIFIPLDPLIWSESGLNNTGLCAIRYTFPDRESTLNAQIPLHVIPEPFYYGLVDNLLAAEARAQGPEILKSYEVSQQTFASQALYKSQVYSHSKLWAVH